MDTSSKFMITFLSKDDREFLKSCLKLPPSTERNKRIKQLTREAIWFSYDVASSCDKEIKEGYINYMYALTCLLQNQYPSKNWISL